MKFDEMKIAVDTKAIKEHMKKERESDKAGEKDNRMRSPTVLSTGIPSTVLQAQKAQERQNNNNGDGRNNGTKSPLGTNNDSFLGMVGNNQCHSPLAINSLLNLSQGNNSDHVVNQKPQTPVSNLVNTNNTANDLKFQALINQLAQQSQ